MDSVGRLLLRFLLVPLGALLAILVAVAVVVMANWRAVTALAAADVERQGDYVLALVAAGPELMLLLSAVATLTLTVAAVGVLIAEAFALRSWIFHAANGGLATWIGWSLAGRTDDGLRAITDPTALVAAGLAGGLAYWLVAGSTSGFFRPWRERPARPPSGEIAGVDRPPPP